MGEGTIGFERSYAKGLVRERWNPRVRISNTDLEVVQETVRALKAIGIPLYVERSHLTVGNRQNWNICVRGWKRVLRFVEVIRLRCVGAKRKQLDFAAELIAQRFRQSPKDPYTATQLTLIQAIKGLNRSPQRLMSSPAAQNGG